MSFEQSKLDRSFNQTRGIFDKYVYKTNDTVLDIQSSNYFERARFETDFVGGLLEATCSDGYLLGMIQPDKTLVKILDSNLNVVSMPVAPEGISSVGTGDQWIGSVSVSSANIYSWSEDTGATDPGTNQVKIDNADESLATNIYINETTLSGGSIQSIGEEVVKGDLIRIQQYGATGNFFTAKVNGTPIDNGDWWTVPVDVLEFNGGFVADIDVAMEFWPTGFRFEFDYAEDETENITANTSFQTKLPLTTQPLEAGNYLLSWAYSMSGSSNNSLQEAQVTVDASPLVECDSFTRFTDLYICYSSFKVINLTAGVHQINIDYRAVTNSAKIKGTRLKLDKLF